MRVLPRSNEIDIGIAVNLHTSKKECIYSALCGNIKQFPCPVREAVMPTAVQYRDVHPMLGFRLRQQGILVTAIRPPTVPENTARLRITFSAAHTEAQVDRLLDALAGLGTSA